MSNNVGRFSMLLRLSKKDKILLKYKKLLEDNNMEISSVVKYVFACNLLNIQPICIGRVCINDFDTDSIDHISFNVSNYDYDGLLYDWVLKQKEEKKAKRGIKVSTYLKRIITSAIELCDTPEEQYVTDTYLDSLNLLNRISNNSNEQALQINAYNRQIPINTSQPVKVASNSTKGLNNTSTSSSNTSIRTDNTPPESSTKNAPKEESSSADKAWATNFKGLLNNSVKRG